MLVRQHFDNFPAGSEGVWSGTEHGRPGFDTPCSLTLADRLNQLPPHKPVEPGREERATRVETTPHPKSTPDHKSPDILTVVSTRPAR